MTLAKLLMFWKLADIKVNLTTLSSVDGREIVKADVITNCYESEIFFFRDEHTLEVGRMMGANLYFPRITRKEGRSMFIQDARVKDLENYIK